MLKLEGCRVANGDFTLSADLQIGPGARCAVIGPSGSGKSTLLEAIAGFRQLSEGRITWQGVDISTHPPGKRPVAMLFQDGNLFPHLTAGQNIGLGLRPVTRLTETEREAIEDALARVGLERMAHRKPSELSGGQQSRVALARILVQRRDILLLDEPFAALGPSLKREMLDLVADVVAETGSTLLMVSHDPDDARRICSDAILVSGGVALPPMKTQALLDDPPPALRDYLG